MKASTRINLHCHSVFSDGELTPEVLADKLASAGVVYASLQIESLQKKIGYDFLGGAEWPGH